MTRKTAAYSRIEIKRPAYSRPSGWILTTDPDLRPIHLSTQTRGPLMFLQYS